MPGLDLPIFPLPLVLFPGVPQRLHIFEPRYRRMLADVLAHDHRFGLSWTETGGAPDPAPRPGDAGCVALVQACQPLPDGRSNIVTVGEARYFLQEYLARDRPYAVARVELFDDTTEQVAGLGDLAAQVTAAFRRWQAVLPAPDDALHAADPIPSDPKALSFHVAAALSVEPRAKQTLLVLRSTRARLETLRGLLGPLTVEAASRTALQQRARFNGHGGPRRAEAIGE